MVGLFDGLACVREAAPAVWASPVAAARARALIPLAWGAYRRLERLWGVSPPVAILILTAAQWQERLGEQAPYGVPYVDLDGYILHGIGTVERVHAEALAVLQAAPPAAQSALLAAAAALDGRLSAKDLTDAGVVERLLAGVFAARLPRDIALAICRITGVTAGRRVTWVQELLLQAMLIAVLNPVDIRRLELIDAFYRAYAAGAGAWVGAERRAEIVDVGAADLSWVEATWFEARLWLACAELLRQYGGQTLEALLWARNAPAASAVPALNGRLKGFADWWRDWRQHLVTKI